MTFVVDCPSCRRAVTVADDGVGRVMACPHCSGCFSASADGAAAVPVAAAAGRSASASAGTRFTFACQRCSSVLEGRSELSGQSGVCPTCGAVFVVPGLDAQTGLAYGPATVADDGQLPTPMHAYATAGGKGPVIRRTEAGDQVIVCPRCRAEMPVESETCSACGVPFTMEGAATMGWAESRGSGLATAALTVGILSILTFCAPILGVVALGLGIAALRRAGDSKAPSRKLAIAGIICGLVSIGLFIVLQFLR